MRSYNRAVRHDAFHVRIIVEVGEQVVKNTGVTPASEALVYTVPLAVFGRKSAPLCAGTQHPKGCFDKAATMFFITNIDTRMFLQKRQNPLPLVIS
jgi:hypothetical protein